MQESQRYFKVTMFFPLADNEGNLFDDDTWGWWRDELTRCHSAFTDLGSCRGVVGRPLRSESMDSRGCRNGGGS
jgi:hypothetical protein